MMSPYTYSEERGNLSSYDGWSKGGSNDDHSNSILALEDRIRIAMNKTNCFRIWLKDGEPYRVLVQYDFNRQPTVYWNNDYDAPLTPQEESSNRVKLLKRLLQYEKDFLGEEEFNKII